MYLIFFTYVILHTCNILYCAHFSFPHYTYKGVPSDSCLSPSSEFWYELEF